MERLDQFVRASARLTGFDRLDLHGTGVSAAYLGTLDAAVGAAWVDRLLAALVDAEDPAVAAALASPELGPVARALIYLWYTGTWRQLPGGWRAAHGALAGDTTHVVSAGAYLAGLQWKAVRAHAPGGDPTGFGSWAEPALEAIR